ncbi:tRNA (guanosine(46)-N7)-methyltransferase TrmB [Limosilactobacillus fermentum]|uniref:tRNA (guanosine(46)-N7)-methyltransferase TrmB n=1 Tax=Limosilactobacillus fermentum TaxID=1613 RepID=UPI001076883B|nr:tRNA (guanosine(46)-N7)-methyltransferase TrmB [Limosilactobacillus fermentum]TFZ15436.1 tRNA (guanosine(46)-N7)-methyltransferase TrmB [Limosilactobacillus fermentum]UVW04205.1 tRNA (guanosine(46)-N7)-methyltransferase TrmB [Limosilactobacillus fermentum]WEN04822.1 tRNA (guanosine(46)-N7)-methyltransferase TrmB [Limosilactobacillus fermentum]WEN11677.1 tRNA (guanosine(46)-N7)-methyltransferase TrmB [Limosilactobacillus fermentum]WJD38332.1 tRNA (guanosine(46)-N7)-methyltransferase TrmB [Li
MRVKHKKWAVPLMEAHPEMMTMDPASFKGRWQERFAKPQPLQVEVGMGKGQFIIGMAKAHPEINFIGLEIESTVAAIALKNALPEQLPNLTLVRGDGAGLDTYFEDGSIDRLYLNFSDPWPKTRHEKRRLTYKTFLANYQQVVKPGGGLEFKTDNQGLFEYSLTSLNNFGMIFDGVWLNLHESPENEDNVETEYEQRFASLGQPIYKLKAHFPVN